jgi:hypothetical protein
VDARLGKRDVAKCITYYTVRRTVGGRYGTMKERKITSTGVYVHALDQKVERKLARK